LKNQNGFPFFSPFFPPAIGEIFLKKPGGFLLVFFFFFCPANKNGVGAECATITFFLGLLLKKKKNVLLVKSGGESGKNCCTPFFYFPPLLKGIQKTPL
ncbi:hypothetical protein ACFFWB_26915, partial [Flavobacterium procerum]|uniref:hypothetical protein n=1 Tax=Flavobacterium procerum TaxID=1455569 RepID=UPI0035E4DAC9